jgi:hypothetical protein
MEKISKSKKAYIVKGSSFSNGDYREWIEGITLSRERAESIKKTLNRELLQEIEKGGEIADKNLKSDPEKVEWNERIYSTGTMNEDEYALFYLYKKKNPMPFKVYEIELS